MRGGALADLTRRDLILLVNLSEGDLWLAHVDLAGAGMSHIDLAGAEVELKQTLAAETILQRRLKSAYQRYDLILIDTPPSLGILTLTGLALCFGLAGWWRKRRRAA